PRRIDGNVRHVHRGNGDVALVRNGHPLPARHGFQRRHASAERDDPGDETAVRAWPKRPSTGMTSMRTTVSSGSPFEPEIGFSRAVRVGDLLAVSGTAPIAPDGSVASPGDVHGQTRRCLEI